MFFVSTTDDSFVFTPNRFSPSLAPLCRFSIKQIMEIGTIPTSLKALLKVGMVSWWLKLFLYLFHHFQAFARGPHYLFQIVPAQSGGKKGRLKLGRRQVNSPLGHGPEKRGILFAVRILSLRVIFHRMAAKKQCRHASHPLKNRLYPCFFNGPFDSLFHKRRFFLEIFINLGIV